MSSGRKIRAARTRSGKSLREVSRNTGLSPTYLSMLENDKAGSPVCLSTMISLGNAVGVDDIESARIAGLLPQLLAAEASRLSDKRIIGMIRRLRAE